MPGIGLPTIGTDSGGGDADREGTALNSVTVLWQAPDSPPSGDASGPNGRVKGWHRVWRIRGLFKIGFLAFEGFSLTLDPLVVGG